MLFAAGLFSQPMRFLRASRLRILFCSACVWAAGAAAASAGPVIINFPFTAKPGDVVSLAGSGFGAAPKVYLKPAHQTAAIALATKTADDATVVVEAPKTGAFDLCDIWIANGVATSPHVVLNAPKPQHFDSSEIASGVHFRIFGRNLLLNLTPTVTLIDAQTNAQLKATVTVATSSAYHLDVVAPTGIVAGHNYQANVSNGYAAVLTEATVPGHAAGTDHFQIGQPWAYDFVYADGPTYKAGVKGTNQKDHHVFNVETDPSLIILAKGDGKTNDAAAIGKALGLAAVNGGVVYLPAGTYNVGTTCIVLPSNVVLQGASAATTKIIYSPTATAHGGFYIPGGTQMTGIADLSIQNTDRTSLYQTNLGTSWAPVSKTFLQRVTWDLGSGTSMTLVGDRIAVLHSTITQAINSRGKRRPENRRPGTVVL
jgi:hypothetical protein